MEGKKTQTIYARFEGEKMTIADYPEKFNDAIDILTRFAGFIMLINVEVNGCDRKDGIKLVNACCDIMKNAIMAGMEAYFDEKEGTADAQN